MKQILSLLLLLSTASVAQAQIPKTKKPVAIATPAPTELYELVKKLLADSTGYTTAGDWAVGNPKKYPVQWKEDRIIMSEDTSINFYRMGAASILLNGKKFEQDGKPVQWSVMLKGPRMGYFSFSIISSFSQDMKARYTIDSVFGKNNYTAKLVKSCDTKDLSGFYYYSLKLPKKEMAFIKLSWITVNGKTAIRIDCHYDWNGYAVKLDCKN
jgi:hypothetical protein